MSAADIGKAREIADNLASLARGQGTNDKARTLQAAGQLYIAIHNAEKNR